MVAVIFEATSTRQLRRLRLADGLARAPERAESYRRGDAGDHGPAKERLPAPRAPPATLPPDGSPRGRGAPAAGLGFGGSLGGGLVTLFSTSAPAPAPASHAATACVSCIVTIPRRRREKGPARAIIAIPTTKALGASGLGPREARRCCGGRLVVGRGGGGSTLRRMPPAAPLGSAARLPGRARPLPCGGDVVELQLHAPGPDLRTLAEA